MYLSTIRLPAAVLFRLRAMVLGQKPSFQRYSDKSD